MPRNKSKSSEDGILTIPVLAKIMKISAPTLRKWFDSGKFKGAFLVPTTKERRIPAPSVADYLKSQNIPMPLELNDYIEAYKRTFGDSYPHTKTTFTHIATN